MTTTSSWSRDDRRGPRRNPGNTESSCRIPRATSSASSSVACFVGERGSRRLPARNQTNQGPRRSRSVARVIFHVDMDAFYVSVERRQNPDLVGKPGIVGADPQGGRGRGVVMAASYEARQIDIRSGMPISMAWHKAPQAVFLRPNYDLYAAVSESVIDLLRSFADVLEHVSIDEAFLDVTSKVHGF